jgi:hypothetical protein
MDHRSGASRDSAVFSSITTGGPHEFFGYTGCGFGEDIQLLRGSGVSAEGWDPHYRPETPLTAADCVNLGYVLNVIEDLRE